MSVKTITVKCDVVFVLNWNDGKTQEIKGSDIVDAFNKNSIPLEKMCELKNWEFKNAPKSERQYMEDLSKIPDEAVFEIDLDAFRKSDFDEVNGIPPAQYNFEQMVNITGGEPAEKWVPPTTREVLESWGFNDSFKVIVVTCLHDDGPANYHHKLLLKLMHVDIPVVININNQENLPRIVKKRLFKIPQIPEMTAEDFD